MAQLGVVAAVNKGPAMQQVLQLGEQDVVGVAKPRKQHLGGLAGGIVG